MNKKTLYSIMAASLLIAVSLSFVVSQNRPTYHKITNQQLVKLISGYIDDGKGTIWDKESSHIIVTHRNYVNDTGYVYSIRYFFDDNLLGLDDCPLIFCEPINGKKVFFRTNMYNNFLTNDYQSIGNYIEDKKSLVYRDFLNILDDLKRKCNYVSEYGEELFVDYGLVLRTVDELVVQFDRKGIFVDTISYKKHF